MSYFLLELTELHSAPLSCKQEVNTLNMKGSSHFVDYLMWLYSVNVFRTEVKSKHLSVWIINRARNVVLFVKRNAVTVWTALLTNVWTEPTST